MWVLLYFYTRRTTHGEKQGEKDMSCNFTARTREDGWGTPVSSRDYYPWNPFYKKYAPFIPWYRRIVCGSALVHFGTHIENFVKERHNNLHDNLRSPARLMLDVGTDGKIREGCCLGGVRNTMDRAEKTEYLEEITRCVIAQTEVNDASLVSKGMDMLQESGCEQCEICVPLATLHPIPRYAPGSDMLSTSVEGPRVRFLAFLAGCSLSDGRVEVYDSFGEVYPHEEYYRDHNDPWFQRVCFPVPNVARTADKAKNYRIYSEQDMYYWRPEDQNKEQQ